MLFSKNAPTRMEGKAILPDGAVIEGNGSAVSYPGLGVSSRLEVTGGV
jgi:hypothetical protein